MKLLNKLNNYTINKIVNSIINHPAFLDKLEQLQKTIINETQELINTNYLKIEDSLNTLSERLTKESVNSNKQVTSINTDILDYRSQVNSNFEKIYLNNKKEFLNPKRYFSQFGEDEWLVNNLIEKDLSGKKLNFFIDIGAGDGITYSNTYFFEKIGWKGICIEPDIRNFNEAKKYRANVINIAIKSYDGECDLIMSYDSPDLSSTNQIDHKLKTVSVKCNRLQTLLEQEKINEIDLMSIDVEGAEKEVWESFNYEQWKPKIVIVEYRMLTEVDSSLEGYFTNKGYILKHKTKTNLIFKLA